MLTLNEILMQNHETWKFFKSSPVGRRLKFKTKARNNETPIGS